MWTGGGGGVTDSLSMVRGTGHVVGRYMWTGGGGGVLLTLKVW